MPANLPSYQERFTDTNILSDNSLNPAAPESRYPGCVWVYL